MNASTRTPEGWSGHCPICGHELCIEPSLPSRDATCPHCGSLVWLSRVVRAMPASQPAPAPHKSRSYSLIRLFFVLVILQVVLLVAVLVLHGFELRLNVEEFFLLSALALLLFGRRLLLTVVRWVRLIKPHRI
jgi:hypothetical protein